MPFWNHHHRYGYGTIESTTTSSLAIARASGNDGACDKCREKE